MKKSTLSAEDQDRVKELYNQRFKEHGHDIKTVGWGDSASQKLRFEVLFRNLNPKGKTILDVGCGLGDLIPYLELITKGDFTYIGVDVAEELINAAAKKYPKHRFIAGDIFSDQIKTADISVLSGALTFKVKNNEEYAQSVMAKMFEVSKEAACLNFLTSYVDFENEKNHHYKPETVFSFAKTLTKKVNLLHDYPLWEFTVQMFR